MSKTQTAEDHTIKLRDQRTLGYRESGDLKGFTVLFLHGSPGSRLEGSFFTELLHNNGLRLIAVDRPGIGLSTSNRRQSFGSFNEDLHQLVQKLNLSRYSIIAISGGVPFALSYASSKPEGLVAMTLISGLGPLHNNKEVLAKSPVLFQRLVKLGLSMPNIPHYYFPILFNPLFHWYARTYPMSFIKLFALGMCLEDKISLANPPVAKLLAEDFLEGLKNGSKPAAQEFSLFLKPWKFDLTQITCSIAIWHGDEDQNVPVAFAYALNEELPGSELTILKKEGHFSLALNYTERILRTLAQEKTVACS